MELALLYRTINFVFDPETALNTLRLDTHFCGPLSADYAITNLRQLAPPELLPRCR